MSLSGWDFCVCRIAETCHIQTNTVASTAFLFVLCFMVQQACFQGLYDSGPPAVYGTQNGVLHTGIGITERRLFGGDYTTPSGRELIEYMLLPRRDHMIKSTKASTFGLLQKLGLPDSRPDSGVCLQRHWSQWFQLVARDVEPHHN